MSHVWQLEAAALGQVALAALVLGAGLPALFALGVRASALGRGPAGDGVPSPTGRVVSALVYAAVVLVALAGIGLIVASGFGKAVSFEHVYPVLVDK
ncbi:hypothetical protein FHN55_19940 [Streptomyces sp. NP160]|uniref:hypothetical protein n=1 Tax=Streptomyces sp. NP160 TaxID=2586637 RepID=UPI00111B02AE|nr:hypothetical protein [Streptomyces sp. NP160]TNM59777.1 hypothetical protein FHN55_19940 [Streptomyces sp. NP160]